MIKKRILSIGAIIAVAPVGLAVISCGKTITAQGFAEVIADVRASVVDIIGNSPSILQPDPENQNDGTEVEIEKRIEEAIENNEFSKNNFQHVFNLVDKDISNVDLKGTQLKWSILSKNRSHNYDNPAEPGIEYVVEIKISKSSAKPSTLTYKIQSTDYKPYSPTKESAQQDVDIVAEYLKNNLNVVKNSHLSKDELDLLLNKNISFSDAATKLGISFGDLPELKLRDTSIIFTIGIVSQDNSALSSEKYSLSYVVSKPLAPLSIKSDKARTLYSKIQYKDDWEMEYERIKSIYFTNESGENVFNTRHIQKDKLYPTDIEKMGPTLLPSHIGLDVSEAYPNLEYSFTVLDRDNENGTLKLEGKILKGTTEELTFDLIVKGFKKHSDQVKIAKDEFTSYLKNTTFNSSHDSSTLDSIIDNENGEISKDALVGKLGTIIVGYNDTFFDKYLLENGRDDEKISVDFALTELPDSTLLQGKKYKVVASFRSDSGALEVASFYILSKDAKFSNEANAQKLLSAKAKIYSRFTKDYFLNTNIDDLPSQIKYSTEYATTDVKFPFSENELKNMDEFKGLTIKLKEIEGGVVDSKGHLKVNVSISIDEQTKTDFVVTFIGFRTNANENKSSQFEVDTIAKLLRTYDGLKLINISVDTSKWEIIKSPKDFNADESFIDEIQKQVLAKVITSVDPSIKTKIVWSDWNHETGLKIKFKVEKNGYYAFTNEFVIRNNK